MAQYPDVMAVKDQADALREIDEAAAALGRVREQVLREVSETPGITVAELANRLQLSPDALIAFAETASELLGDEGLDVETARRAALIAASGRAWENALGPLLSGSQVRELLGGISRQRVDELMRHHRLIGLRGRDGRRRFPAFQFLDGQPLEDLISAYWTIAADEADDWTVASWCVSPDPVLDGMSPVAWIRDGRDAERLQEVADHDAARLRQ